MTLWKRLLWQVRIRLGIAEVKRLSASHPNQWEYQTEDALSAFMVFIEFSSQADHILETTEEEGELIQMLFLRQWEKPFVVTPEQVILTAGVLAFLSLFEMLGPTSWLDVIMGFLLTTVVAWQSKRILHGLALVHQVMKGKEERDGTEEETKGVNQ